MCNFITQATLEIFFGSSLKIGLSFVGTPLVFEIFPSLLCDLTILDPELGPGELLSFWLLTGDRRCSRLGDRVGEGDMLVEQSLGLVEREVHG